MLAPLLANAISPRTWLDVGCGEGHLVAALCAEGIDAAGVDGPWVSGVRHVDLSGPLPDDLGRFDVVSCLEVAEHVPADRAAALVEWLCSMAPVVVFSGAIPGQGGVGHVNEQWPAYWAELFAAHGFTGSGEMRRELWSDEQVEWWYRQNLLVFTASPGGLRGLGLEPDGCPPLVHPGLWMHRTGAKPAKPPRVSVAEPLAVRIVVPRRADGGERDRLWAHCRAHWERELPDVEIVEGHHDEGPFNRSAAVNSAAAGAWDVAVILDADVLLDPGLVMRAARRAHDSGSMVLPFRSRALLTKAATDEVMEAGGVPSGRRVPHSAERSNVSTCVVVPRRLWDEVGGFDERFIGWGGEDDAFWAACSALGGVMRLPGVAWHLWHEISPWRDHASPLYVEAKALSDRYRSQHKSAEGMRRLLDEPRDDDQIVAVVLTNGARPDALRSTLASLDSHLTGPVCRRVVVNTSGSPKVDELIRAEFPGWDVERVLSKGYAKAMRAAISTAVGSGQPWVFWCEDDFTFTGPVDLRSMRDTMTSEPNMVQLSLLRQPWYPHEREAGSVFAADPDAFTQGDGFVRHRAYWTCNPHLTRRRVLASHEWPRSANSERLFGKAVFTDPDMFGAVLGSIDDAPRCIHIGEERAGTGY